MFKLFNSFLFVTLFQYVHGQELLFKSNDDSSQIQIPVTVNKEKFFFLFDNAAEHSFIFLNAPNMKHYKIKARTLVYDGERKSDTAYIVSASIHIPELKIKSRKINIAAVAKAPKQLERDGVSGILGLDIINNYDWLIDFDRKAIKVLKGKSEINEKNYYRLNTIKNEDSVLSILVKSNGASDTFNIDFGDNETISTFSRNLVKTYEYIHISQYFTISQNRIDTSYICVNNVVSLNDSFCVYNVPIYYSKNNKSNLIGVNFFKKFGEVIIMNSNNQILLGHKEYSIFKLNPYVFQDNKIVSITQKVSDDSPKRNIGDLFDHDLSDSITLKKIILPATLYKVNIGCGNER